MDAQGVYRDIPKKQAIGRNNMDGYELIEQIQQKSALLDKALQESKERGVASADAEQAYKVALAKAMLIERDKGTPVTILSDICKGQEEIAGLRRERDIADALYKSSKEAINVYKIQLRVLQEQAEMEWGRG